MGEPAATLRRRRTREAARSALEPETAPPSAEIVAEGTPLGAARAIAHPRSTLGNRAVTALIARLRAQADAQAAGEAAAREPQAESDPLPAEPEAATRADEAEPTEEAEEAEEEAAAPGRAAETEPASTAAAAERPPEPPATIPEPATPAPSAPEPAAEGAGELPAEVTEALAAQPTTSDTPPPEEAAREESPEAAATEAATPPPTEAVAPPEPASAIAEAQTGPPPEDAPPEPGALPPGPEMRAWRARVAGGTQAIPVPHLTRAPRTAANVRARGAALRGGRAPRREAIEAEAEAAVSEPPEPVDPPPQPPPDPVPAANELVEAETGKRLPDATMPDLVPSPRGTQPLVRDPAARRPPPEETAPEDEAPEAASEAGEAEPTPADQEAVDAVAEAAAAPAPETIPGTAEGVTITDEPPPPPRPLPPAVSNIMREVIARLLVNPREQAEPLLERARRDTYPNEILPTVFPDIGSDRLDGLTETLTDGLNRVAEEAGIAADELNAAVESRRREVEAEAQAAAGELEGARSEETDAVEEASADELAEVSAAEEAQNARVAGVVTEATGEGSPDVIELRRDQQIHKINRRVGDITFGYDRAKDRRHAALDRAKALQNRAYDQTATDDQAAIEAEADDPSALAVRLEKAGIRTWADAQKRMVGERVTALKGEANTATNEHNAAVRQAGNTATEQVRDWAAEELGETRSWWDELWAMFTDWSQQAEAQADNWATVRAGEARDATLANMGTLQAFIQSQGEDVDLERNEAFAGLTEEQQAVIRAYYASPPDNRDALGAVATGLRFRLAAQQKPELINAFKREVLDKPDSAWEALAEIGQAQSASFSVETIADNLYEAMFGGVTGWGTDEEQIYSSVSGLTPEQGRAVRAHYAIEYRRNLDADLESELDEDNALIRARAALEGDPVMETVGALNEAMAGLGTDEETIMRMLRGKTAEQRARIMEEYERQYGVDLEAELDAEMDDHDQERAEALLAGDTRRADAIALDQAMHGGVFGWGTDEEQIEGVYSDIRNDVANMQVPDGQGGMRPLTAEEMEAEIARRNLEVEATYNEEYGAPGEQESALRAAYRDELSGPRLDLANALADNDLAAADAARIEIENQGFYTDDDVVNGVLENQYNRALDAVRRDPYWRERRAALQRRAREEGWDPYQLANAERALERQMEQAARSGAEENMRALEERYDAEYSRWGSGGLQVVIAFNMSGTDQEKARALVEQGGYLTRAQQVDFATRGAGTDEEALDRALAGLTREEIEELDQELRRLRPGETLEGIVASETSGREEFDMRMRLQGEPENAEQEMQQARQRAEWELRNSPVGGVQRQVLERRLARLEDRYRVMNDPDAPEAERAAARRRFMARAGGVESAVEKYRNQVDAVADAAATAAALTAAITVTVLTGGVAGAVLGALAAAAATMATKAALKGGAYGGEELAVDAVVGIVDAIAAATTAGMGNALLRVAATQGGRFARLGGTRLAGTLARMAASGSRAQRMIAHGIAESIEGAVSAIPAALAGNMLNDKNWEQGNPLVNIARGTLIETGMGAATGGVFGSLGGVRAPQPAAPPPPRSGDLLARRGTPQERLDAWRAHRAENPDANMRDFLRQYDAEVSARLAAESADAATQRALRSELLAGIPPRQRRQFADTPIEVMPDDEFRRLTRSSSANAVTLVENGQARIILREGAPASALREEGIHLQQLAEPDLGRLGRRLDERRMRNWDDLSLGEQLELYAIKLELEIDAQRRLLDSLDADLRRGGPDIDADALRRQRAAAAEALDNLRRRSVEVADLGPLERIAMSRGILDPPPYLDQPARLFQKLREEIPDTPAKRADPQLPRRELPRSGAESSPLGRAEGFDPSSERVMQIGREWVEPKNIKLNDGATFTLPSGTQVEIRNGGPVRVSTGKSIDIPNGTEVTFPNGNTLSLRNGNTVVTDIRYREVEVIGPDGTVREMRQEAMSVSHADLGERGWVQRGSESARLGGVAEEASRAVSKQHLEKGEITGIIEAQNPGGSGFDGVELTTNTRGEPVLTVIEVKNYPGRYVPFEDFTAVTVNLKQNLDALYERLTVPESLIDDVGIAEAYRRHAKALGLDESVLRSALDALEGGRVELEIRLAPGTLLGRQGTDSAFNRMWDEWRRFGSRLGLKGRKKPLVTTDITETQMDSALTEGGAVKPDHVGRRPDFYRLIENVPSGERLTDRQIADARIATLGLEAANAPPHAGKLDGPLQHLGQPLPFKDSAGRPIAVREVSAAETQGDALDALLDDLAEQLTTTVIMPGGSHADVMLALGLSRLNPTQRSKVREALARRLATLPGGDAAARRVIHVTEPI